MKKTTLSVHLVELKRRLLYSLFFFFIFFAVGLFYRDFLYDLLTLPLVKGSFPPHAMLMTSLTSGFSLSLRFGFLAGVFFGMPFFIYQIWRYVVPALKKKERFSFRFFFTLFPFLFYIGAVFAYLVITPLAWDFLLSFYQAFQDAALPVQFLPQVDEYLNLMSSFVVTFGLAFELPLVLILLMRLRLLSAETLVQKRRFVIVGIFIAAAFLTPPDVLSQLLLALPLIFLYEVSIWIGRRF